MLGLPKIYKGTTAHSDDHPNHYLKSSSKLQKGENNAPLRINLALSKAPRRQFHKLGLIDGMCMCSPGIMTGLSPESQPTH